MILPCSLEEASRTISRLDEVSRRKAHAEGTCGPFVPESRLLITSSRPVFDNALAANAVLLSPVPGGTSVESRGDIGNSVLEAAAQ